MRRTDIVIRAKVHIIIRIHNSNESSVLIVFFIFILFLHQTGDYNESVGSIAEICEGITSI